MGIETATAVPRSAVSCTIEARSHRLIQDKPPESGGADAGMMASELLLAGLLACQLSTFVKVAAKRRLEVRATRLTGEMHFEAGDIHRIELHFDVAGAAEPGQMETLLRLTDSACTISKVLSVPIRADYRRSETAAAPESSASST